MAVIRDETGRLVGFVRGRGLVRPRCGWCLAPGTLRCDYRLLTGRTCDARMCHAHASEMGPNRDYCWIHAGRVRQP